MKKRLYSLILFLLFCGNFCWGQTDEVKPDEIRAFALPSSQSNEPVLEKAIDPKEYIVGPGDELTISLWGELNITHILSITPEGTLLVPRIGSIYVGGLLLSDAKREIENEISQQYRNVELTITLTNLRKFKVSVAGEVNNPGTYVSFANQRVSEIVEKAGGFKSNSSKRNIMLKRQNGVEIKVDVLKFLVAGDNRENPYVLDGDIVYVAPRELQVNIYGIYGAVKSPGEYEYSPKDNLLDLILLAQGLTVEADLAEAEIVRFNQDNKTTQSIKIDLKEAMILENKDKNLPLQPDDRVFIRSIPEYREKKQVIITGEVVYPGVYAIDEEKDKLTDLIKWVGGFTKDASLPEAEIIRGYNLNIPDAEFERLKKIPIADMSPTEYEYLKTKSREKAGRVACDFNKLFLEKDKSYDVLLKRGDVVDIPPKRKMINVSGSVINPGLVNYAPDKNYHYYIEKAGGFSFKARKGKTYVIKSGTGKWVKAKRSIKLEGGDTVWIPEKPDRDYWKFFKDAMVVMGNAATIYLATKEALR